MRTFYSGVVTLTYISDESMKDASVADILEACDSGPAIAGPMKLKEAVVTRERADQLAIEYGSDAEFFNLTGDEEEE